MHIPDYAKLRENAGKERAEEIRRLAMLFRRAIRRAVRSIRRLAAVHGPHGSLHPVPVRYRRWSLPYDIR
jgi:hypothetical protein